MISGLAAKAAGISSVIDLVGIRCSAFRLALAKKYIAECKPVIIKGNASEIRTLAGERGEFHDGIDTAKQDRVSLDDPESIRDMEKILKKLAVQYRAVIMATGAVDLISDGENTFAIENGVPEMGRVTGTGCILNCLIASFLSVAEPLEAAVLAASVWGISGELGDRSRGLGTYHIELLNQLSLIDGKRIKEYAKIKRIEKGIGYGFS
jgi:hydroxyethylthiazole kinase